MQSVSILSPRETCPPLTFEAHAAAMGAGDVLLHDTANRVILATVHATGEITGDKRAALDAVRNSQMDATLRVALIAALHQAVLLDESIVAQAAPRPARCVEMLSMHKRGIQLTLERQPYLADSFVVLSGSPRMECRSPTALLASRFARQAAQAKPDTHFLVLQAIETFRMRTAAPRPQVAA